MAATRVSVDARRLVAQERLWAVAFRLPIALIRVQRWTRFVTCARNICILALSTHLVDHRRRRGASTEDVARQVVLAPQAMMMAAFPSEKGMYGVPLETNVCGDDLSVTARSCSRLSRYTRSLGRASRNSLRLFVVGERRDNGSNGHSNFPSEKDSTVCVVAQRRSLVDYVGHPCSDCSHGQQA